MYCCFMTIVLSMSVILSYKFARYLPCHDSNFLTFVLLLAIVARRLINGIGPGFKLKAICML